ncbi:UNVERIFIED_CONTAM: hypothetical protein ODW78_00770, partial [Salmonella enterica subsp. enterica serovar Enteritidis]
LYWSAEERATVRTPPPSRSPSYDRAETQSENEEEAQSKEASPKPAEPSQEKAASPAKSHQSKEKAHSEVHVILSSSESMNEDDPLNSHT